MAASDVRICNLAFTILGAARILDLNEDSENARRCNAIFPDIRDEVLAAHPWNFAIKRKALGQLVTAPEFGYSYQYQLPTDCLRVLETEDDSEFKIEGKYLLTDSGSVKIKYISRIEDASFFSPAFVTAMGDRMAAELAYAVTKNASLRESMIKTYTYKNAFAKAIDGQEGSPEVVSQNDAIDARE